MPPHLVPDETSRRNLAGRLFADTAGYALLVGVVAVVLTAWAVAMLLTSAL